MLKVDSPALAGLLKVLGIPGRGEETTFFDDGNLQQAVDVAFHIRRSRTIVQSEGIFTAGLVNTHVGGDAVSLNVDPYAFTAVTAGFPTPVPEGFDVWVLNLFATATAATLIDVAIPAWLALVHPSRKTAFGTVAARSQILRMYDAQITTSGGLRHLIEQGSAQCAAPFTPQRVPRGSTLTWFTNATAATAGNLICAVTLGLFPAGMGQDAVGAG